jgi:hypothetical protein
MERVDVCGRIVCILQIAISVPSAPVGLMDGQQTTSNEIRFHVVPYFLKFMEIDVYYGCCSFANLRVIVIVRYYYYTIRRAVVLSLAGPV